MASVSITVQIHTRSLVDALAAAAADWPETKRNEFSRKWKALAGAGAQMVEVRMTGGVIQAFPSEDFTQHCLAHGVKPWW